MAKWVNGLMDLWVNGSKGQWVNGFMGLWVIGSMGQWVNALMGQWVSGSILNAQNYRRLNKIRVFNKTPSEYCLLSGTLKKSICVENKHFFPQN